jgi:iron complex transport system ATP-binding protein
MGPESNVAFAYTAAEVVLLGRLPLHGGAPGAADRAVASRLLETVDCGHLAERVFSTLSTGERQRVGIARAVAQVADPPGTDAGSERYLLLDEPTSSLDPAHQHLAMRLLQGMAASGRGVLAVLHDLNLAAAYAHHIVLLHEGRVAARGVPAEVLREDLLETVFGVPMLVVEHERLHYPMVVAQPIDEGRPEAV